MAGDDGRFPLSDMYWSNGDRRARGIRSWPDVCTTLVFWANRRHNRSQER